MADTDNSKKSNGFTPILPFDRTLHEDFTMYDNPKYTRDISLFDKNEVMMNRGNVIHFFECKTGKPRKIGGDIIDTEITSEEDISDTDYNDEGISENASYDEEFSENNSDNENGLFYSDDDSEA